MHTSMRARVEAHIEVRFARSGFTKGGFCQLVQRSDAQILGIGFRGTLDAVKLNGGRVETERLRVAAARDTYSKRRPWFRCSCYEPYSDSVFLAEGEMDLDLGWPRYNSVVRLDGNAVSNVMDFRTLEDCHKEATENHNGFTHVLHMASDGAGGVYLVTGSEDRSDGSILKLSLPESWRAEVTVAAGGSAAGGDGAGGSPAAAAVQGNGKRLREGSASSALASAAVAGKVEVSMVLAKPPACDVTGLAFDARTDSLVFSSVTAVYRLPMAPQAWAGAAAHTGRRGAAAAVSTAAAAAAWAPVLIAGKEGERGSSDDATKEEHGSEGGEGSSYGDSSGGEDDEDKPPKPAAEVEGKVARFSSIGGVCVDGDGNVYLVDNSSFDDRRLSKLSASTGGVSTLVKGWEGPGGSLGCPTILGNGVLVACSDPFDNGYDNSEEWNGEEKSPQGMMLLVDVGAKPPVGHPAAVTAAAAGAAVAGALAGTVAGALAGARTGGGGAAAVAAAASGAVASTTTSADGGWQPGSRDLTILVSGRAFAVHRGVIAACSDFFRPRLVDRSVTEVSLPDADPEAFALLLQWLYTGTFDSQATPAQAQAVAELADRLLLPALCHAAQAQVLAGVSAETVVGAVLWAQARGVGSSQLLSDLKAWFLAHQEEVLNVAASSIKRLMAESPDLAVELQTAAVKRARMQ